MSDDMAKPDSSENPRRGLFGKLAIARRMITQEELDECLALQGQEGGKKLGEILVEQGYMTASEVEEIIRLQQTRFRKRTRGPGAPTLSLGFRQGQEFLDYHIEREFGLSAIGAAFELRKASEKAVLRILSETESLATGAAFIEASEALKGEAEQAPGLAKIHATGWDRQRAYTVYECFDGGSLMGILTGQPVTHDRAVKIITEIAEAVAFAHKLKVMHGDIRPRKIHFRGDGSCAIRDFRAVPWGVSSHAQAHRTSLNYLAPEQLSASAKPNTRTDVYGLGAVFYHLLSGRPPIKGQGEDLLKAVQKDRIERIRKTQPKVPVEVEAVCMRALDKKPEKRYADASVFLKDCLSLAQGDQVSATPLHSTRRIFSWFRRKFGGR